MDAIPGVGRIWNQDAFDTPGPRKMLRPEPDKADQFTARTVLPQGPAFGIVHGRLSFRAKRGICTSLALGADPFYMESRAHCARSRFSRWAKRADPSSLRSSE
jgi:hypothetical protein